MEKHSEGSFETLIDISPPMGASFAIFPGDTPLSLHRIADQKSGADYTVSTLTCSVHCGAHADAPLHYDPEGISVDELDLRPFLGLAEVLHLPGHQGPITIENLTGSGRELKGCERLLVRTDSFGSYETFTTPFSYFEPETITYLSGLGARLVGIDTPSVDPYDSKTLPAHGALKRHGLRVLENLDLSAVGEGQYFLVALPLKLVGADASPVRAILSPR